METDTIEFRHFPGTLDPLEVSESARWCFHYLRNALDPKGLAATAVFRQMQFRRDSFPSFPRYNHKLESRYRATCLDGTNTRATVAANVAAILEGRFDD
jgi:hypothetical protein